MMRREIDQRSLAMARAIDETIDHAPERRGLERARDTCQRWLHQYGPDPNVEDWQHFRDRPWEVICGVLPDPSEEGRRRRQNSPFAGVLPPRQRGDIYRRFRDDPTAA
ncbi:MAG: hypothetical protein BWZ02_01047 [Lentisphaerae bacterium ADurb.BinA184]|nr:MAG: hypothetical protein BWZ02_01047 [Lentisphaerae bacterium ADurb.BinA184]